MKERKNRDDRSLWDDFLTGNSDAFATIFDRYVRIMFMYGSRFCGDREMVKDCIQDVFVRMYFTRDRLGRTDNIKYYLFGALRNSIVNALKKDGRRNALYEAVFKVDMSPKEHEDRLEFEEEQMIMDDRIAWIMCRLTQRERQIIHYRYTDNLSVTEISDLLNISYQSVVNTIYRAIKRIRTDYLN